MPFPPGQSGNPEGARIHKQKRFFNALDRAIEQDDAKRLRSAAEKLLDEAAKGESWALQMLADRLDGKPAQQVQIQGDAEQPLVARIEQVIVDPSSNAER